MKTAVAAKPPKPASVLSLECDNEVLRDQNMRLRARVARLDEIVENEEKRIYTLWRLVEQLHDLLKPHATRCAMLNAGEIRTGPDATLAAARARTARE